MKSLIIGLGQVGGALRDVLADSYEVVTRDIAPNRNADGVECVHICYPYTDGFVETVTDYIREYSASLCIIHSTVVPGTTDRVQAATVCDVAYSPVRGRHGQMKTDLLRYTKFVGASTTRAFAKASCYLRNAGFTVRISPSARALELAKLLETTYSGLLIGWAQDMQRFCDKLDIDLADALALTDEVEYLPKHEFYPGHIGGQCIMANLDLLEEVRLSDFAEAIRKSNQERCWQAKRNDEDLAVRHWPRLRAR
jgi:UDP-N-acetyl-D-mannosaminuronate dehydrogenase